MKIHYPSMLFSLLFMLGFLVLKAVSTGDVLGQVIEKESMKPVPFAKIVFENSVSSITISANEYGYYYANRLPIGKYQMRVSYNNRTFILNKIRVYDSYSASVDFVVSNDNSLPELVELMQKGSADGALESRYLNMAGGESVQENRGHIDALILQRGLDLDIAVEQPYIKASSKGFRELNLGK